MLFLIAPLLLCVFAPVDGGAAEIRIDGREVTPGRVVKVPVVIDGVEDLAGVRIVLRYDAERLRYLGASRAEAAARMMQVVNDKRPGVLIIVMAGATGIRGSDLPLLTLDFEPAADLAAGTGIELRIAESQLMSARLEDIVHAVEVEPLIVVGGPENDGVSDGVRP